MVQTPASAVRGGAQAPPRVSVIVATYNRSAVLRHALESARWQTVADWELIVVGDHCTDDTAAVVASFDDPRIRFVNLPENCGEQAGPNNHGLTLSRGRYVAYLNHDDIWLPDHLERALAFIEETGADLVFPLPIVLDRHGCFACHPVNEELRYDPSFLLPASFWLLRRALLDDLGPWRASTDTFSFMPSQELLTRAWRAGKTLRGFPAVTVIILPAAGRPQSYVTGDAGEQARLVERFRSDPGARERLLSQMVHLNAMPRPLVTLRAALGRALAAAGTRLAIAAGLSPRSLAHFIRYRRRGGLMNLSRRARGLPPLPPSRRRS